MAKRKEPSAAELDVVAQLRGLKDEMKEAGEKIVNARAAAHAANASVSASIRLRKSLLERISALVEWCDTQPEFEAVDKVTASDVHRMALAIGIKTLEQRKRKDDEDRSRE